MKSISKIQSMTKIDDDLAEKMKAEVNGGETFDVEGEDIESSGSDVMKRQDGRVLVDPSVLYHVERLKRMFNVSSLEEIIEATPVNSSEGLLQGGGGAAWHDDTLDRVNTDISSIEAKLVRKLKSLNTEKTMMEKDEKLLEILARMLREEMGKIRKIKDTYDEHRANLAKRKGYVRELEAIITSLERQKIDQLEKLEKFADAKKEQALYTIGKDQSEGGGGPDTDLGDIDQELDKLEELDALSSSGNSKDLIDKNAHNVFPLKKIKSIKKIKSMTVRSLYS